MSYIVAFMESLKPEGLIFYHSGLICGFQYCFWRTCSTLLISVHFQYCFYELPCLFKTDFIQTDKTCQYDSVIRFIIIVDFLHICEGGAEVFILFHRVLSLLFG